MVRVIAEGPIDFQSSISAMLALVADPEFNPDFQIIVDLRRIQYEPNTADLSKVTDALAGLRSRFRGPITLLVAEKELYMARLACIMASAAGVKMTAKTEP